MHLDPVGAVLEGVVVPHGFGGELALLADGHETGAQVMGDGPPKDEAARLDPRDLVDPGALVAGREGVDGGAEARGVAEQGGDVAKQNAGLGIIGNAADQRAEIDHRTRPATAPSLAATAGSRMAGAVISAPSSARSQPWGQASGCSRRRGAARRTSSRAATTFFAITAITCSTVTAPCTACQQS